MSKRSIPFAVTEAGAWVSSEDGPEQLVSVHCPSCKQPMKLEVDEGDSRLFVHDTDADGQCFFSVWDSLQGMARDLFRQCAHLRYPSCYVDVQYPANSPQAIRERVTVTDEGVFSPFGISIGVVVADVEMDVLFEAGEWQLGVVVTHPGQGQVTLDYSALWGKKTGIVAVGLEGFLPRIDAPAGGLRQTFQQYLYTSVGCKQWLYHPRRRRVEETALDRLERQWRFKQFTAQQAPSSVGDLGQEAKRGSPVTLRCACGQLWAGRLGINSACPACRMPSAVYAVPVN